MKRLIYFIPFLGFAVLAAIFYVKLEGAPPEQLPSAMIGKKVPAIALVALDANAQGFTPADLASGRVSVVNVWASWCAPCRLEAPLLASLAQRRTSSSTVSYTRTNREQRATFCASWAIPLRAWGSM